MRTWAQPAPRGTASGPPPEKGQPATRPPGPRTARPALALPAAAATGLVAILIFAGAGVLGVAPAMAAPREAAAPLGASVMAGHRAVREGVPGVAPPGWLAGASALSMRGEQASGPAAALASWERASSACDDVLAVLGLAAASCVGSAGAIAASAQPGAVLRPCPDQVAPVARRPLICREQAPAQWRDGARRWPTCGCQRPPSLGPMPPAPVLPTHLPLTPPTPSPARPTCGCHHPPVPSTAPIVPISPPARPAMQVPWPSQAAPAYGCEHPSSPGPSPAMQLPAAIATHGTPAPATASSAVPAPRLTAPASTAGSPRPASPARAAGASPGILPVTGFDLEGAAEIAVALLVAGGGSLLASRLSRRRPGRPSRPGRAS